MGKKGGLTKNSGTTTDIRFPNLFTGGEGKKRRKTGEKVNMMMMMMMMMRGWRIILKLVDYINLLNCNHKTFKEKKNNGQCRI